MWINPTSWNGQTIQVMPSTPGLRTVDLTMQNSIAVSSSP